MRLQSLQSFVLDLARRLARFGHEEDHGHGLNGVVLCHCLRLWPAGLCLHHGFATTLKTVCFFHCSYCHTGVVSEF
jgi:hypothetical protein